MMKFGFVLLFFISLQTGMVYPLGTPPEKLTNSTDTNVFMPPRGMRCIWSDEFSGPGINLRNWSYETKETGWNMYWNNEYQMYTDNGTNGTNAFISNGCLVIRAYRAYKINTFNAFRSARLTTEKHRSWKYGVIAARIKMPYGNGMWPAFWMLGSDIKKKGWPACGEIDIAEMVGGSNGLRIGGGDNVVSGALHGPGYAGDKAKHAFYAPSGEKLSDDFHVYWVHWTSKDITWFIDETQYLKVLSTDVEKWVFNRNFFIILNLAVGGNWPGYPDRSTVFPQTMVIDWVRVYQ